MMKSLDKVKERKLESQFESSIRDLFSRVPFLELESFQSQVRLQSDRLSPVDFLIEIYLGSRHWKLIVEGKNSGQPRVVRNGVLQLENYLMRLPKKKQGYGVIMAPFISEKSAHICKDAGLGYMDLAGNAFLSFDQVFIDIRTAQNPFREKRELRSLFTPKAGRVLMVLLTPPSRAWKVEELSEEASVSLGHVSNVRKRLIEQEWARADDTGLRLTKPEELAQSWQDAYQSRPRKKTKYYSVLHGEKMEMAIRAAFAEAGAGEQAVLSSFSAAKWIAPYARQATHFFYANSTGTECLQRHLQLEPTIQGENVVIEEPREDDVFKRRMEPVSGIFCTGLVQTWLDLNATGERGREAAQHLLEHKLLPEWKENA